MREATSVIWKPVFYLPDAEVHGPGGCVKGHACDPGKKEADALANQGMAEAIAQAAPG